MTIGEWLRACRPLPPAALLWRIETLLGEALRRDISDGASVLLAAGERIVTVLVQSGSTSRESALDLLAADALVTYAFEAASLFPESIAEHADSAMQRIAALAEKSRE